MKQETGMSISSMQEHVGKLSDSQGMEVLMLLMEKEPRLTKKIYDLAIEVGETAKAVDADQVAEEIYSEIYSLDEDVLYSRSGRTRYGYVHIGDASYEMLEEAVEPFFDELKKRIAAGPDKSAKDYCIGLIRGLKKSDDCNTVVEYSPDSINDYIHNVVRLWESANPSEKDLEEVKDEA
ncbi:MAG: hypothetical protein LBT59_07390 [Clostridiales bacterium]|nr:hypothetical protein [Clostridiales bacterium]